MSIHTLSAEAVGRAEAALHELGIDDSQRVDVYDAVNRLGLWLRFEPLDAILGALVPPPRSNDADGTSGYGVLITSLRGRGLQRFTCAHEIAHWQLHRDELALDAERDVLGGASATHELVAQVFAAHFLMPAPLVLATLDSFDVDGTRPLAPEELYSVAREMGSSYHATALRLVGLGVMSDSDVPRLLRERPTAKVRLTRGYRRPPPRGDVYVVAASGDDETSTVHLHEEDEIFVALPENPTTGYRWVPSWTALPAVLPRQPPATFAEPTASPPDSPPTPPTRPSPPRTAVRQSIAALPTLPQHAPTETSPGAAFSVRIERQDAPWAEQSVRPSTVRRTRALSADDATDVMVGEGGNRYFAMRALRAGAWRLSFDYRRGFDANADSLLHYEVHAVVAPALPTSTQPSELVEDYRRAMADG